MNESEQLRSLFWIMLIALNCSLGSIFYGYSLSYMNVSLKYIDKLFSIEHN